MCVCVFIQRNYRSHTARVVQNYLLEIVIHMVWRIRPVKLNISMTCLRINRKYPNNLAPSYKNIEGIKS